MTREDEELWKSLGSHANTIWPLHRVFKLAKMWIEGIPIADIIDAFSANKNSVIGKVGRLADAGILQRRKNPVDRSRAKKVYIPRAGKSTLPTLPSLRA